MKYAILTIILAAALTTTGYFLFAYCNTEPCPTRPFGIKANTIQRPKFFVNSAAQYRAAPQLQISKKIKKYLVGGIGFQQTLGN